MGYHRLPPTAVRLRMNRGFDSAWYADAGHYAKLLQKDWLLTRAAWSYVQRSSRTMPAAQLTKAQQMQQLAEQRRVLEGGPAAGPSTATSGQAAAGPQQLRDYPNFRMARVLLQHLPYKSYVNTFAYVTPKEGPQAKYGFFKPRFERR